MLNVAAASQADSKSELEFVELIVPLLAVVVFGCRLDELQQLGTVPCSLRHRWCPTAATTVAQRAGWSRSRDED